MKPGRFEPRWRSVENRVEHHHRTKALRSCGKGMRAERPAPVLDHEDHVAKVELVDQRAHPPTVIADRMRSEVSRLVAEAEADEVGHDHAKPLPLKTHGDLAIKKTPGGIPVHHQHGSPLARLHHMHVMTVTDRNAIPGKRDLGRDPWRKLGCGQSLHGPEATAALASMPASVFGACVSACTSVNPFKKRTRIWFSISQRQLNRQPLTATCER